MAEPGEVAQARRLWTHLETIHAITYFAPESHEAADALGLRGFWMGYFGFRAAPMGAVAPAVVEATFANFAPTLVQRAVPDVWSYASPSQLIEARQRAGAAALRRLAPEVETVAMQVEGQLRRIIDAAGTVGRPLFAANRGLEPDDAVEQLWQQATSLREQRGDGHVAALADEGVTGCGAHLLLAADLGTPIEVLERSRGWTSDEWAGAAGELRGRGLLDGDALTDAGRRLRRRVEATTNRLAAAPIDAALGGPEQDRLMRTLRPLAAAVAASGAIPYPNPIGLPAIDG